MTNQEKKDNRLYWLDQAILFIERAKNPEKTLFANRGMPKHEIIEWGITNAIATLQISLENRGEWDD